ncbi:MAG: aminotransferase class V-fold PLP-dependent enzyme [Clostridiales bacterium]|nr:aminotransferase class V-fold PLP-dependent enzyme [Clostridiales bacterium]
MIYLDNAATTFPKPQQVIRAMTDALQHFGANPGRGGHQLALQAGRTVEKCREAAASLLGTRPERVVFTRNCTESLNLAIMGTLRKGDEVICSHGEHNAVMRPLERFVSRGEITVKVLRPDARGLLSPDVLRRAITDRTGLVVICHASNVTGVIQPVRELGAICREKAVPLLVDAAQTAGVLDVTLDRLNADMIALPGHKGLLGPHGTGLLALGADMNPEPLILGGTGSASESVRQPELLPDRYESGTMNLPGIAGLLEGIEYVIRQRTDIHRRESMLNDRLRRQLANIRGLRILGDEYAPRVAITSVVPEGGDSAALADALDATGVAVRGGLHCAPAMHSYLGTLKSGAVRFSPGPFTTERDIDDAAALVARLMRR